MVTPVAQSHVHQQTIEALQLLLKARTMLKSAYKEPSLEPSGEELGLLHLTREAQRDLGRMIADLAVFCDREALTAKAQAKASTQSGRDLLNELRQEGETVLNLDGGR